MENLQGKIATGHREESLELTLYSEAGSRIEKIVEDSKKNIPFSLVSTSRIISELIDSLLVCDDLVRKAIYSDDKTLDIPFHLVNTSIFAIKVGMGLRYNRDDLEKLGLAAIIHDIGMVNIPEAILKKPGKLSSAEFEVIKKHPSESALILKNLADNNKWMPDIILQEHERYNGTGYPNGLKGNEIDEFAQIIGIADVYEALTHHRFQRKNFPPFDSMKEILSVERASFPEKIIKALLCKLPVFPAGTMVKLNSHEIGVVIATDSYSPFRPTIEVILDPSGRKLRKDKIVNLRESHLLYIIALVSEEDIPLVKTDSKSE